MVINCEKNLKKLVNDKDMKIENLENEIEELKRYGDESENLVNKIAEMEFKLKNASVERDNKWMDIDNLIKEFGEKVENEMQDSD